MSAKSTWPLCNERNSFATDVIQTPGLFSVSSSLHIPPDSLEGTRRPRQTNVLCFVGVNGMTQREI